ncbi:MAG: NAD(+) diphosphatase [Peptococcaceae bacterium]|jgi:NAD+ diphosphatase|nr:NAD(+) diphosphatase [Peptococcaceae bacterium]
MEMCLNGGIFRDYAPSLTPPEQGKEETYWFIFLGNRLLVCILADERLAVPLTRTLEEIPITWVRQQYLGTFRAKPCYSVEAAADAVAPEGLRFMDLRRVFDGVDASLFLLAGRAVQIVQWDLSNQYCGGCGTLMAAQTTERAKKCPNCGQLRYPQLSPAIIVAVFKDQRLLMAHNVNFAPDVYSIIAGFVEPGETLEECVERELWEEVKIQVKNIRYIGSQPWPFPNSLMLGFVAEYAGGEIQVDGSEVLDAAWFSADQLPVTPKRMSIAGQMIAWFAQHPEGC